MTAEWRLRVTGLWRAHRRGRRSQLSFLQCPLLALSGRANRADECPHLGE